MHVAIVHHSACEGHVVPGHPECPGRVRAILDALAASGAARPMYEAPRADDATLRLFHTPQHVRRIHKLCDQAEANARALRERAEPPARRRGRRTKPRRETPSAADERAALVRVDDDTRLGAGSREAALRAAGGAVRAVDLVLDPRGGDAAADRPFEAAFAVVRPPGHHAAPAAAEGFCVLNNAAVAALHARRRRGLARVAVVDPDVHHGNGTEAGFAGEDGLLYASLHQLGDGFYPGTGGDPGAGGAGAGGAAAPGGGAAANLVNAPLPAGAGGDDALRAIDAIIAPALAAFAPELLIISAGFDAHRDDPLGGLRLDADDFDRVTARLCAVAAALPHRCPVVSVLEGGYGCASPPIRTWRHRNARC